MTEVLAVVVLAVALAAELARSHAAERSWRAERERLVNALVARTPAEFASLNREARKPAPQPDPQPVPPARAPIGAE